MVNDPYYMKDARASQSEADLAYFSCFVTEIVGWGKLYQSY